MSYIFVSSTMWLTANMKINSLKNIIYMHAKNLPQNFSTVAKFWIIIKLYFNILLHVYSYTCSNSFLLILLFAYLFWGSSGNTWKLFKPRSTDDKTSGNCRKLPHQLLFSKKLFQHGTRCRTIHQLGWLIRTDRMFCKLLESVGMGSLFCREPTFTQSR